MPPSKAFASHLARFAFTPSPTKPVPSAAVPSRPPRPPAQHQPTTAPGPPSSASSAVRTRPARSAARAVSRHFGSASGEGAVAGAPVGVPAVPAVPAVKVEEDGAHEPDGDEPARKKAKAGKSKKKPARAYADPSVYAHLGGVPDTLEGDIKLVLCGELMEWPVLHAAFKNPTDREP